MGALDVHGLWRINKAFRAGVQVIELEFFYYYKQIVYCVLAQAQRGTMAQHYIWRDLISDSGVESVTAGTALRFDQRKLNILIVTCESSDGALCYVVVPTSFSQQLGWW